MGRQSRKIANTADVAIKHCKPLNHAYLATVTFGDEALRQELLALFRAQLAEVISKLPQIRNGEDWRFTMHSLRGAAAALGADEIAALCKGWEEAGMPGVDAGKHSGQLLDQARDRFEKALLATA